MFLILMSFSWKNCIFNSKAGSNLKLSSFLKNSLPYRCRIAKNQDWLVLNTNYFPTLTWNGYWKMISHVPQLSTFGFDQSSDDLVLMLFSTQNKCGFFSKDPKLRSSVVLRLGVTNFLLLECTFETRILIIGCLKIIFKWPNGCWNLMQVFPHYK